MGFSNGKVTAPVSMKDVENAVGVTQTNGLSALCRSSNINMWAKYKPVVHTLISTTSQLTSGNAGWKTEAQLGTTQAWWRGTNNQLGLDFPVYDIGMSANNNSGVITALNSLKSVINGQLNGWSYIKPSGGSSSPYRLLDFFLYNSKAPRPITGFQCKDAITGTTSSSWEMSCSLREANGDNFDARDYVVPQDVVTKKLGSNRTLTLGFAMFNSSKVPMAWTTGLVWNGRGIKAADWSGAESSTYQSGDYIITTPYFKNTNTYLVLPVYFILVNISNLAQIGDGSSVNPTNSLCKLVPVPFVNFTEVTCSLVSTTQRYGKPTLSNHNMGMLSWAGNIYLDRQSNPTYYNASGNGIVIQYALVNELWNGSYYTNTWASGSYTGLTSVTKNISGTSNVMIAENKNITVSGTHTWKMVVIVAGDGTTINLRQYEAPVTPT